MPRKSTDKEKLKQIAWLIDFKNGEGFFGTALANAIQKILSGVRHETQHPQ